MVGIFLLTNKEKSENQLLSSLAVFVFIPLLVSVIFNLIFNDCGFGNGYIIYILLVFSNVSLSFSLAFLIKALIGKNKILFFVLVTFLMLFSAFFEFYFYPQIYIQNFLFFIPGPIYDEYIPISFSFVSFRTILFILGIVVYYFFRRTRKAKSYFLVYLFVLTIIFFLKPFLGLSTPFGTLENKLDKKIETKNFEIYFDNSVDSLNLQYLILLHEYYFNKINKHTSLMPEGKVKSYVFKDKFQKKRLFGSKYSDVSKIWMNSIFTDLQSIENTLNHELVHSFSSQIGNGIFKMPYGFNPSLLEGYAMAFENDFAGYDISYFTRFSIENGYDLSVSELFSGFNFFSNYSGLSYLFAGSFMRFLYDNFGIEKLNLFYSSGNFKKVFGNDIENIEKVFKESLNNIDVKKDSLLAKLYFGKKPYHKKKCVRWLADLNEQAEKYFNNKNYYEAIRIYDKLLENGINYPILIKKLNILFILEDFQKIIKICNDIIFDESYSQYHYSFLNLMIKAEIYSGNFEKAEIHINKGIEKPISDIHYISLVFLKTMIESNKINPKLFYEYDDNQKEIIDFIFDNNLFDELILLFTSNFRSSYLEEKLELKLKEISANRSNKLYLYISYYFLRTYSLKDGLKYLVQIQTEKLSNKDKHLYNKINGCYNFYSNEYNNQQ